MTPYTVHGILQAKILECEAFPFSRGSSQPRDQNLCLPHCRWILYQLSHNRFISNPSRLSPATAKGWPREAGLEIPGRVWLRGELQRPLFWANHLAPDLKGQVIPGLEETTQANLPP